MPKMRAIGTRISYLPAYNSAEPVIDIGSLTSIGEITPDSEELDATTLDSPGGFREFVQGFKDSGEVPLSGFHNKDAPGQAKMRELYASGAEGYFWVTFPDITTVAFTAHVKSYSAGSAEVDGLVGFGCALRVSGIVQVVSTLDAVAQAKTANSTATMDSTAVALTGTVSYQWKTATGLDYAGAANATGGSGATAAVYTTPALTAGTKYYFCEITVSGYRPVNSPIHVITVT